MDFASSALKVLPLFKALVGCNSSRENHEAFLLHSFCRLRYLKRTYWLKHTQVLLYTIIVIPYQIIILNESRHGISAWIAQYSS